MGEWELGAVPADGFPISRAVAASSAFPPVFPPLLLDEAMYPVDGVEYVTLSDGGVYDNLGVDPLLRASNNLNYSIVSDAGKPFEISERPTESGTIVLRVSIDILMEQVRGLQFQRLQLSDAARIGAKPVWFSIDSVEGEELPGDAVFASSIGTNLRKLREAEISVLMRQGAALLEPRLARYAPEFVG